MEFKLGDTVYALRVLGRSACCEAPAMLFAMRGYKLEIVNVCDKTSYDSKQWYEVKLKNSYSTFHVTGGDITLMKHFDYNYSQFQRDWDKEKARDFGGW